MRLLVSRTTGGAKAAITGDLVTNPLKAGQLLLLRRSLRLGVDVDHVARPGPLIAAHWLCRLQVLEPAETQGLEHSAHSGERCGQDPGNATERAALMAQIYSVLQLLWIERPPLGAANTASIHQSGGTA
jgi:hypothetical protein